MKRVIVLLTSLLLTTAASAIDTGRAFDDPQLQARYLKIISEVRCVQCQNQSIKDSNVPLASDLRREIRRLISEGKTDADIADFLVARYGEFVLCRPKMLALWIIPFLLLSIGGFALFRIVRHRMTLPMDDDATGDGQSQ